jgi:lipopolysaccharide cholinephosphotransferase
VTECERILEKGLISKEYINEEVRDGYKISKEMKKLQIISLDLLMVFDEVCRKNNLKYFCAFGTLLGAVRHKGFIPWDDDVDLFMLREDFDKLYSLASEFQYPYFLQTPYTDPTYFFTDIRLRNSETAYIDKPFKYQGFNMGIHLSVAPLDYLPDDYEEKYNILHKLIMDNSTYMRMTNPCLNERDTERVRNYNGNPPLETYEKIHAIAKEVKPSTKIWTAAQHSYEMDNDIFEFDDFSETVFLTFENIKVPVPQGYDKVLSTIYGNYMELPAIGNRHPIHVNVSIDPDRPYSEIIEEMLEF